MARGEPVLVLALLAALIVGLALGARPALAQQLADGAPRAGEPSWRDYVEPSRRRARQLRREGLAILLDGLDERFAVDVAMDRALIRFERARRALRDDPDLLYFTAVALATWERRIGGEQERRIDEAIAAYEELRAVDPDYHADRVAFELALLHSRRGDHAAAIAEYRRALAASVPPPAPLHYPLTDRELALARLFEPVSVATVQLNLAENLMLVGELSESVERYRRAVAIAQDDPITRVLALWGLAVALDRSGDHLEAVATARRAILADPLPPHAGQMGLGIDRAAHGPMAILHSRLVFFEPAHEVHAYDAIGREALARAAEDPASREEQLRRARGSWRAYLAEGGNAGRYAGHAHRALERIEAELSRAEERAHVAPRPRLRHQATTADTE